jgi:hypothetical protein
MGNALLGVPQAYTITSPADATAAYPMSNITNDEPGLIWRTAAMAQNNTRDIDITVSGTEPIGVIAIFGLLTGTPMNIRITSYPTTTDRANGTNLTEHRATINAFFSANRSSDRAKILANFTPTSNRYFRIRVTNQWPNAYVFEMSRLLMTKKIQPPDNIEVGASFGIDDRSSRRYARSGRRNIDPTVIMPTFSGGWPWIETAQMRADFRPLMLQRGATFPALFVMDPDETTWGEDEMIYGDLEKTQSITYEDGQLFSYFFNIVGIIN